MRILLKAMALAAAVALFPVPNAGAETSFERLRRNSSLWPDEDLAALLEKPGAKSEPPEMKEADPFFSKILGQILAEADAGNPPGVASQLAGKLRDSLGLYGQALFE